MRSLALYSSSLIYFLPEPLSLPTAHSICHHLVHELLVGVCVVPNILKLGEHIAVESPAVKKAIQLIAKGGNCNSH